MNPATPARDRILGRHSFDNGYGASVIDSGYGSQAGLLELAVFHDGRLCYSTPITGDVIGWLTTQEASDLLDDIAHLPTNGLCAHRSPLYD